MDDLKRIRISHGSPVISTTEAKVIPYRDSIEVPRGDKLFTLMPIEPYNAGDITLPNGIRPFCRCAKCQEIRKREQYQSSQE